MNHTNEENITSEKNTTRKVIEIKNLNKGVGVRRFAAFSILYIIGVTVCVSGLLFNGGYLSAASGVDPIASNSALSIGLWVILGVLTVGFIIFSVLYLLKKRQTNQ